MSDDILEPPSWDEIESQEDFKALQPMEKTRILSEWSQDFKNYTQSVGAWDDIKSDYADSLKSKFAEYAKVPSTWEEATKASREFKIPQAEKTDLDIVRGMAKSLKSQERREATTSGFGVMRPLAPQATEQEVLGQVPAEKRQTFLQKAQQIKDWDEDKREAFEFGGKIFVQPELSLDADSYKRAVDSVKDATPEAKQKALDKFPSIQKEAVALQRDILSKTNEFQEFAKNNPARRFPDGEAGQLKAYFDESKKLGTYTNVRATMGQVGLGFKEAWNQTVQSAYGTGALATQLVPGYGVAQATFEDLGSKAQEKGQEIAQQSQLLGGAGGEFTRELTSGALSSVAPILVGAGAGTASRFIPVAQKLSAATVGFGGSVVASGFQSLGSTYLDALNANTQRGMSQEDAAAASIVPALASGASTALITAIGGKTGVESVFRARNSLNGFLKEAFKELAIDIPSEATEEFTDQLIQGVVAQMSYDPDKSMDQVVSEAVKAGVIGGVTGGLFSGGKSIATQLAGPKQGEPTAPTTPPAAPVEEVPQTFTDIQPPATPPPVSTLDPALQRKIDIIQNEKVIVTNNLQDAGAPATSATVDQIFNELLQEEVFQAAKTPKVEPEGDERFAPPAEPELVTFETETVSPTVESATPAEIQLEQPAIAETPQVPAVVETYEQAPTEPQVQGEREVPVSQEEVQATAPEGEVVTTKPKLYRQSSIRNALAFIPNSGSSADSPFGSETFFASSPDLALGQGENKGVLLEFDDAFDTKVSRRKPAAAFSESVGGIVEKTSNLQPSEIQKYLTSVTIEKQTGKPSAELRRLRMVMDNSGWTKVTNTDGSIKYTKPTEGDANVQKSGAASSVLGEQGVRGQGGLQGVAVQDQGQVAQEGKAEEVTPIEVGDDASIVILGKPTTVTINSIRDINGVPTAYFDFFGLKSEPLSKFSLVKKSNRNIKDAEIREQKEKQREVKEEAIKPEDFFSSEEMSALSIGKLPDGWTLDPNWRNDSPLTDTNGREWSLSAIRENGEVSGVVMKSGFTEVSIPAPKEKSKASKPKAEEKGIVGKRVRKGSTPAAWRVLEVLPQTETEKANGEQFVTVQKEDKDGNLIEGTQEEVLLSEVKEIGVGTKTKAVAKKLGKKAQAAIKGNETPIAGTPNLGETDTNSDEAIAAQLEEAGDLGLLDDEVSIPAVLEKLGNNKSYKPWVRQIAKVLAKVAPPNVSIEISYRPDENFAALFITGEPNRVVFNLAKGHAAVAQNLLHELAHAISLQTILNYKNGTGNLTPMQKSAVKRLESIFNDIKKSKAFAGDYGITNVDEMIGEAFSSPAFKRKLEQHGFLRRILVAIGRLFNLDIAPASKWEQVINLTLSLGDTAYVGKSNLAASAPTSQASELDAAYMQAVESGDMPLVQRMVERALFDSLGIVGFTINETLSPNDAKREMERIRSGDVRSKNKGQKSIEPLPSENYVEAVIPVSLIDIDRSTVDEERVSKYRKEFIDEPISIRRYKRSGNKDRFFVMDGGHRLAAAKDSGVYALRALLPESELKSPAITRDEQGNIVPLSQRFNPESPKIYASAPKAQGIDSVYLRAVEDGDTDAAKKSLDEFLRLKEKTQSNAFDIEDKRIGANRYRGMEGYGVWMLPDGRTIPVDNHAYTAKEFFNSKNTDYGLEEAFGRGWIIVRAIKGGDYRSDVDTVYVEGNKQLTSDQRKNINDWAAFHGYEKNIDVRERRAFQPKLIVKDSNDNVIPLSQRFNYPIIRASKPSFESVAFEKEENVTTNKGLNLRLLIKNKLSESGLPSGFVKAFIRDKEVGYLPYGPNSSDSMVQVGDMTVSRDFRRKGIATAMFNFVRNNNIDLRHHEDESSYSALGRAFRSSFLPEAKPINAPKIYASAPASEGVETVFNEDASDAARVEALSEAQDKESALTRSLRVELTPEQEKLVNDAFSGGWVKMMVDKYARQNPRIDRNEVESMLGIVLHYSAQAWNPEQSTFNTFATRIADSQFLNISRKASRRGAKVGTESEAGPTEEGSVIEATAGAEDETPEYREVKNATRAASEAVLRKIKSTYEGTRQEWKVRAAELLIDGNYANASDIAKIVGVSPASITGFLNGKFDENGDVTEQGFFSMLGDEIAKRGWTKEEIFDSLTPKERKPAARKKQIGLYDEEVAKQAAAPRTSAEAPLATTAIPTGVTEEDLRKGEEIPEEQMFRDYAKEEADRKLLETANELQGGDVDITAQRQAKLDGIRERARDLAERYIAALPEQLRGIIRLIDADGIFSQISSSGVDISVFGESYFANVLDDMSDSDLGRLVELGVQEEVIHAIDQAIDFIEASQRKIRPDMLRSIAADSTVREIRNLVAGSNEAQANVVKQMVEDSFNLYNGGSRLGFPEIIEGLRNGKYASARFASELLRQIVQLKVNNQVTEAQLGKMRGLIQSAVDWIKGAIDRMRSYIELDVLRGTQLGNRINQIESLLRRVEQIAGIKYGTETTGEPSVLSERPEELGRTPEGGDKLISKDESGVAQLRPIPIGLKAGMAYPLQTLLGSTGEVGKIASGYNAAFEQLGVDVVYVPDEQDAHIWVQPNGRVILGINDIVIGYYDAEMLDNTLSEELIHAVSMLVMLNKRPSGMDASKFVALVHNRVLSDLDSLIKESNSSEAKTLRDAFVATVNTYGYSPENESRKFSSYQEAMEFASKDVMSSFVYLSEFLRQVVQAKVRGKVTESTLTRFFNKISQWFKDALSTLTTAYDASQSEELKDSSFSVFARNSVLIAEGILPKSYEAPESRASAPVSEADAEYLKLAQDPEKNKGVLQRMVDAAAKAAGLIKGFHGSPDFVGKWFDRRFMGRRGLSRGGFSFAPDRESAESYMRSGADQSQRIVDDANSVMVDLDSMIDRGFEWSGPYNELEAPRFRSDAVDEIDEFQGYLKEIARTLPSDLKDRMLEIASREKPEDYTPSPRLIEAFIRNPKLMDVRGKTLILAKSVDDIFDAAPVTYDDNGNIIPLSQRFNPATPDIRASAPTREGEETVRSEYPAEYLDPLTPRGRKTRVPIFKQKTGPYKAGGTLTAEGKFDRPTFELLKTKEQNIRAEANKAEIIVNKLHEAIKQEYTKKKIEIPEETINTALGNLDNKFTKDQDAQLKAIKDDPEAYAELRDQFLEDNIAAFKVKQQEALESLPVKVQEAVLAMREGMSELSKVMIAEGMIPDNMVATFKRNDGTYLHRSYAIFDGPKWADFVRSNDPEAIRIRNRAVSLFTNYARAQKAVEYFKQQKADGIEVTMQDALDHVENMDVSEEVDGMLADYISVGEKDDSVAYMRGSLPGKKGGSILKIRGQIPSEIRELWGQYNSADINFLKSYISMSSYIEKHRFLKNMLKQGLDAGYLWQQGVSDRSTPPPAFVQLYPDTESYNPMAGVYGPPMLRDALQEYSEATQKDWYSSVVMAAMAMKTVYSVASTVRNFLGNPAFAIANGNIFFVSQYGPALKASWDNFRKKAEGQRAKEVERAIRLGVFGDNVGPTLLAELSKASVDLSQGDGGIANFLKNTEKVRKKVASTFGGVYSGVDDFWKFFNWKAETEKILWAKPEMSREDAEQHAATIVRKVVPTYSESYDFVRRTLKNKAGKFIAPFITFTTEVIRVTGNLAEVAAAELQDPNPKVKAIGAARVAGMLAVMTIPKVLSEVSKGMFGYDDDDEEALRLGLPDWQKDATILWLPKDAKGNPRFIDFSYLNPYNYFQDAINAAMRAVKNGESPVQAGTNAVKAAASSLAQPFLSEQLATGVILDVVRNTKSNGTPVYNEQESAEMKATAIGLHLMSAFTPGTVDSLVRMGKGAIGYTERSGRTYDVVTEIMAPITGQRVATYDMQRTLEFQASRFNAAKADSMQIINGTLKDKGTIILPWSISYSYNRANDAMFRNLSQMRKQYLAAIRLGLTPAQATAALKDKEVGEAYIQQIKSGIFKKVRPTTQTLDEVRAIDPARETELKKAMEKVPDTRPMPK